MIAIRRFLGFWYAFVVGDDWRVALGVVLALAGTWLLVRGGTDPWWLLPAAVAALLYASLRRETRG